MSAFWQSIATHIDPVVFAVGPVSVRWYGICFAIGTMAAIAYPVGRLIRSGKRDAADEILDAAPWIFLGILAGGRLGFALFYDPALFTNPAVLFLPFDPGTGSYAGIRGMSFFGAMIGASLALLAYSAVGRRRFLALSDMFVGGLPLALAIGRIGNFLNLELPGRETTFPLGMSYPDTAGRWGMRHPSVLYEAMLEGAFLFVIVRLSERRGLREGGVTAIFVGGYALVRFLVEFVREPDPGVPVFFGWMTMGQALSVAALSLVAITILATRFRRR